MRCPAARILEIRLGLIGRMKVEGITGLTDADLEQAFKNCVAPNFCIDWAKRLIAMGSLTTADLL